MEYYDSDDDYYFGGIGRYKGIPNGCTVARDANKKPISIDGKYLIAEGCEPTAKRPVNRIRRKPGRPKGSKSSKQSAYSKFVKQNYPLMKTYLEEEGKSSKFVDVNRALASLWCSKRGSNQGREVPCKPNDKRLDPKEFSKFRFSVGDTDVIVSEEQVVVKRGPGRPKGTKNKKKN